MAHAGATKNTWAATGNKLYVYQSEAQKTKRKRRGTRLIATFLLWVMLVGLGSYCAFQAIQIITAETTMPKETTGLLGAFAATGENGKKTNLSGAQVLAGTPIADNATPTRTELPQSVALQIQHILQKPELPNGCEATALATALCYFGFAADKISIAYSYIPREDFSYSDNARQGPNPATAYAGDPATRNGFYCFAPALVTGANRYLSKMGSELQAQDISGASADTIDACLAAEQPVILWLTLQYDNTPTYLENFTWQLPDGTRYTPYANLHCVVLRGYDDTNYLVCDPLQGDISMPKDTVIQSYVALASQAATIG